MSTILEALRRAEQERQRGAVPTVHDPASVLAVPGPAGRRGAGRLWAVAAALMLAAGAAALAWWLARRGPVAVASAPAAAPAAPSAAAGKPAAQAPARPPPAPKARMPSAPAPEGMASSPVSAPKASAPPARAAAPGGPVFAPADLPASVRAELPTLHLAGITWSANPRLRMAVVSGQVLHEGDAAAPGMVLQAIEPTRTVWTFRGYRVALGSQ